ncbi:hypothetical protein BC936DRAFT_148111 [Jimgerdemannia flammicorona]|uniref:RING-type domain-containing protein n=1 Tax=Jimgerdemannia flammicorona TaxID=994334 RepID=A0A433D3T8_9FUNG|nr:hypothetical protein BC936DRAFT_148111 [Jimgerdemannia flammicorona]
MNINAPTFVPPTALRTTPPDTPITSSPGKGGHTFLPPQSQAHSDTVVHGVRGHHKKHGKQHAQHGNQNVHINAPHHRANKHPNNRRSQGSAKQRGQPQHNGETDDTAEVMGEMSLADIAHVTGGSTNKRGQISLNHLLNFSFPERQRPVPNSTPRRHKPANYQPFNKERFVNANFRFLVKPSGDYTIYLADPDLTIDWDDVEQVMISVTEPHVCPICLTPPTSARVTKCGHTFCLPCVLHYLELNENPKKQWRKCPICWDAIYARDLKSVRFLSVGPIVASSPSSIVDAEDTKLDLRLMQRAVHSALALPISTTWPLPPAIVSAWTKPGTVDPPWHFTPDAMQFAKFMLVTPEYMDRELTRDLDELIVALAEAKSWNASEEEPFIEMAEAVVKEQLEIVRRQSTAEVVAAQHRAEAIIMAVERASAKRVERKEDKGRVEDGTVGRTQIPPFSSSDTDASDHDSAPPEAYQHHHHSQDTNAPSSSSTLSRSRIVVDEASYFFFQAADGQHVYLHPLDIRVMKQEFGSYEFFPDRIDVRVVGIEESTLTEDLRKRCKYLSHLPLSCDVTFVETDLKGIVSDATLHAFTNELRQRHNRRKERARRDDKARLAAEAKELSDHQLASNRGRPTSTWTTRAERDEAFEQDPFFQIGGRERHSSESDEREPDSPPSDQHETGGSASSVGSLREEREWEQAIAAMEASAPAGPAVGVAKTVWGTPEVSFAKVAGGKAGAGKAAAGKTGRVWGKGSSREEYDDDYFEYGEEQTVVTKKGKKKLVLLSTNGGRRTK